MKKMLALIIISIITFSFDVFALEYKTVNVTTTFAEDIEFSDVEKVKLTFFGEGIDYVDDASSILNIVELTKDNNYSQTINNTKIVDQSYLFAIVDKDNYGIYNCDITLDTSVVDTANINIHISRSINPKDEYAEIPSDILKKIIGTTTTTGSSGGTPNGDNGEESGVTEGDSDTEITVGTTKPTTTVIYEEELKNKQEQEEKAKKQNNIVSIILFSIIGIVLLIGLVFVVYKFMTANK